jgi:hypothetical protein
MLNNQAALVVVAPDEAWLPAEVRAALQSENSR